MHLYQVIGGTAACRKLSTAFYARVARDPLLRPLFPGKTMTCAIEEFTAFLVQFLGGPPEDTQRRWWVSLHESHQRFKIGAKERDAWMENMIAALDEAAIDTTARAVLLAFFEQSSAYVANTGPRNADLDSELSTRWTAQRTIDEAVAAIRRGDTAHAAALAEGPVLRPHFIQNPGVFVAFLSLMLGSGYLREKIIADPSLLKQRHNGRTLLNDAAAAGNADLVELLIRLGADPNVGIHPPLYNLANECRRPGAARIVQILVHAGAEVDACDNVKRCTALHMAARRDSVEIAEALLDCGADIEKRDGAGETPLRRAVNCNQARVAALLFARGADAHSIGSRGLTPASAARTAAMKKILHRLDM